MAISVPRKISSLNHKSRGVVRIFLRVLVYEWKNVEGRFRILVSKTLEN